MFISCSNDDRSSSLPFSQAANTVLTLIITAEMHYQFIRFEAFTLPYLTFGNGPELMLAFHGYSMQAADFKVFGSQLGERYKIVAFDLFYHGEHAVNVNEKLPVFDTYALLRLIENLLWETKHVRFSIMGYSLGGRLAMAVVQKMAHRIKSVYLMAPDGLKKDLAEEFVTGTLAGDHFYRFIINRPQLFFTASRILNKLGLINDKLYRFMMASMETRESRLHVYRTWNIFKKIKPDLASVAYQINSRKIRCVLFMGKDDKIIKLKDACRLVSKLNDKNAIYLLDCGHQLMQKSEEIAEVILTLKKKEHHDAQ